MAARHPKGLYVLFFTEMWERFGFYLMVALFVLYMNEHLGWTKQQALSGYAWYMFFVYLSPLVGGILADRLLGHRLAVVCGACLLSVGYFLVGAPSMSSFYAALLLLIVGNGLFKPNISTLVGKLYAPGDTRRDSAFSVFYMGINLGALLAGPLGELMRQNFGWRVAFSTAGAGMLLSLVIFTLCRRHLGIVEDQASLSDPQSAPIDSAPLSAVERQRIVALAIICAIVMMFWLAFKQNGGTLPLFTRDNTDRAVTIFDLRALLHGHWLLKSWVIPPGVFSSVNSLFIIVLTPPLVMLFGALRKRGLEPSTPAKLGIGMVLTAGAYSIMVAASSFGGDTGKVGMGWIIGCYLVITLGELCISPMGLSMVTKLAPRRMTAMLMGLWFGSTAAGNWLAGKSGAWFWERWSHTRFFTLLVVTSLTAALVLRVVLRRLAAAMPAEGGDDGPPPPSATSPLILTTPGIGSSVG